MRLAEFRGEQSISRELHKKNLRFWVVPLNQLSVSKHNHRDRRSQEPLEEIIMPIFAGSPPQRMSQKTQNPVRSLIPDCGAHTPWILPSSSCPSQSIPLVPGRGRLTKSKRTSVNVGVTPSPTLRYTGSLSEVTPQGQTSNKPLQESLKIPVLLGKVQKTGFTTFSFKVFICTLAELFFLFELD